MSGFHTHFIASIVASVITFEDRAEWRFDCYCKMLDWMRDNPIQGTKAQKEQFAASILKAIIRGVTAAKSYDKEQHDQFVRDIRALWFKVREQVRLENGSTKHEDIAMMNSVRRDDEGISD
jgi:hypothetical protein